MPLRIAARSYSVAWPLGIPGTYISIGSPSDRRPRSASCSKAVIVKVLVTLPTRWLTSAAMGMVSSESWWPIVAATFLRECGSP